MYLQFIIFFLLLLTGFCCKKFKILSDIAINNINRFIILIAYPCLILARTSSLDMSARIFHNFLLVFAISLGLFLLFSAYAYFYAKKRRIPEEDAPVAELSMVCPNNGFMGFPIAFTFFGDMGLLYMVANNVALNTYFFTYGISVLMRGRGRESEPLLIKIKNFALMVAHPKVSAAIAGIILCSLHLRLPDVIEQFLETVGSCATPMAMISIGTIVAGGISASSLKDRVVGELVIQKILVIPLLAFLIIYFLPFDPMAKAILIVACILPTATNAAILAEQYHRNKELVGTVLVVTTLISMGSIPLGIWLLGLAGLPG